MMEEVCHIFLPLSAVLWGAVQLHLLVNTEIPAFSRKCPSHGLLLTVNNLLVCNSFRKPGNMLLRKQSTCLILGQNFILRTSRQNTALATGLGVFALNAEMKQNLMP